MDIISPFLIQQAFSIHASDIYMGMAIVAVVLHFIFSLCIWNDAGKLKMAGRSSVIMPPLVWGLAAFVLGLIVVVVYWLFHYSSFRGKDT
jgi:hypothetical protein